VTTRISNSPSTTYDCLLSTLTKCVESAQERVHAWRARRAYAVERRDAERRTQAFSSFDRSEYDGWCERIRINDHHELCTELVKRLLTAVQANPFPGQRKRLVQIAIELVPEAGRATWHGIFTDPVFGFPPNYVQERICFPVSEGADIPRIESLLFTLVRDDGTIPANRIPAALNLHANGQQYRYVKQQLEQRHWVWCQRKREGKVERVVIAPRSEDCEER